jgi:antitoxin (DNA-binding transcriptional repressor) of toxin-antitoxin stability system
MKTVNIANLKKRLSFYLQYVKSGEEVIVRDRDMPIARILPLSLADVSEEERQLVASGAMKLPEEPINWEEFWTLPAGQVARELAVNAVLEEREEGR